MRAAQALQGLDIRVADVTRFFMHDGSSRRAALCAKIVRALGVHDEESLNEHIDSFMVRPLQTCSAIIDKLGTDVGKFNYLILCTHRIYKYIMYNI